MSVIANIATIREREKNLFNTVESLLPQVDAVHITYNGYKPTYTWPKGVLISKKDNSKGDAGKFYYYCGHKEKYDNWLFCDDDLIYPPDYVERCLKKIDKFPDAVLSFHGRKYKPRPIEGYYTSKKSKVAGYRCLGDVPNDVCLRGQGTLGTGVMFFKSGVLDLSWNDFKLANMADVWIAKFAAEQRRRLIVCKHEAGWILPQPVSSGIWEEGILDDSLQTSLYNSIK